MLLGKIYQHTQLTQDIWGKIYIQHTSDKSEEEIDIALRNVKNAFI
jgi:hypothetical protein